MTFTFIYLFKHLNNIQVTLNKATQRNHYPREKIGMEIHVKFLVENPVALHLD